VTVEDLRNCISANHREGMKDTLIKVHDRDFKDEGMQEAPTTPGMKYRHYSPSVPVVLLKTSSPPLGVPSHNFLSMVSSFLDATASNKPTIKIGVMLPEDSILRPLPNVPNIFWQQYPVGSTVDLSVMASRLFDGLLVLETQGVDYILIEEVSELLQGLAIMNRVVKASSLVRWINITL